MRITVVALGLAAFISTGLLAQVPAQRHSFLQPHKSRLSIDFGLKQAAKSLPQRPAVCETVRKHRHELVPSAPVVPLLVHEPHRLRSAPATPCPVR